MRKRQSIASVYLVSVSHQCIASVPTFETIHPSSFTPHPSSFTPHPSSFTPHPSSFTLHSSFFTPHLSDFDGLETAPSAPSGVNVARNVVRNVVRGVSRNVSRGVGRMRQYEHLTGEGSPPLFYISHNLSVEMGDFTDKLFILNHLSVRTSLFTDKPVIFGVNPCQDYASLSVSR